MPVEHYENFPVASWLVPKPYRRPIEIIYRFARSADDIADEGDLPDAERLRRLAEYDAELDRIERHEPPLTPLFADVADLLRSHPLPIVLFHDLLSAFSQDVTKKRYADFPELLDYCRRSANPVGRLLLHLFDCASEPNLRHSDCICSALQLANFWQDIAIDSKKARIYLPACDLSRFRIDEAQIADGRWTPALAALVDFQVDRTQRMMREGASLARRLPGRFGWEIRLTVEGGLRILEKVRAVRGDVAHRRPVLTATDWPLMAFRAMFRQASPS